jgi:hypothetical protein
MKPNTKNVNGVMHKQTIGSHNNSNWTREVVEICDINPFGRASAVAVATLVK